MSSETVSSAVASLRRGLASRGVRGATNLKQHFVSMDVDRSGALDFDEFCSAIK